MKRAFVILSAVALAVTFNACEGHDKEDLSQHYQHKWDHGSHSGDSHGKDHGKDHAKKDGAHAKDAKAEPHPNHATEEKKH